MKSWAWVSVLLLAVPAWSADIGGASQPSVRERHDRMPIHWRQADNECMENHNLKPDGDHDCDDAVGIPEPATFELMAIGLGGALGLWVSRKRRRK